MLSAASACSRRDALERAQEIGAARRRRRARRRGAPRRGRPRRARHERAQLGERRVLGARHDLAAHDAAHGRMREIVADRLVEILAADAADERALLDDEDAALPVALAERHRVADARRRADGARGSRHDVARGRVPSRVAPRARERPRSRAVRDLCAQIADAACACPPPPSTAAIAAASIALRPAASDDEHPLVHLHEERRAHAHR